MGGVERRFWEGKVISAHLHDEGLHADGPRAGRAHAVRARHDLRLQAAVLQGFHQEHPAREAQVQTHRPDLVHHQDACRISITGQ